MRDEYQGCGNRQSTEKDMTYSIMLMKQRRDGRIKVRGKRGKKGNRIAVWLGRGHAQWLHLEM